MNKIDIIKPTPKRLCTWTLQDCTYCKYDTPHPCPAPSDWSSEEWNGDKAKEQRSLIDFKLLNKQIQNITQDITQETTQYTTQDSQQKDLISSLENLMLEWTKPLQTQQTHKSHH